MTPRPRLCRRVDYEPEFIFFKPAGVRKIDLEQEIMTVDELEALRLKDFEEMPQEQAAVKMGISQPTFHRLLLSARKKMADIVINGKALRIEGGHIKLVGRKKREVGGRK